MLLSNVTLMTYIYLNLYALESKVDKFNLQMAAVSV